MYTPSATIKKRLHQPDRGDRRRRLHCAARSQIAALTTPGVPEVRVIGPGPRFAHRRSL